MLIIIIARLMLKRGHVESKTRSLSQIIEDPFVHSRGHSCDPSSLNFVRMSILIKSRSSFKLANFGLKLRLLGQSLENN